MTSERDVYIEAKIQESFPFQIAIYDLKEFLETYLRKGKDGSTSLFFDETDESLIIKSGDNKTRFLTSDPKYIISPDGKRINLIEDENNTRFILGKDLLKVIKDAWSKVKLDALIIKEGQIVVSSPERNPIAFLEHPFMKYGGQDAYLNNRHIVKMLPLDYNVEISPKGIARFVSRDSRYKITYFFALNDNEMIDDVLNKSWVKKWKPSSSGYKIDEKEPLLRSGKPRRKSKYKSGTRYVAKKQTIKKKKMRNGEEQHYDENENLVYFKSSEGAEQWYEYDKRENLIHYKTSSGFEKWYEYNDDDNLVRSWSNKAEVN